MRFRKLFWLTTLILAFVLVACGGTAQEASPTAESGGNALSQSNTVESAELGGTVSYSYPEGWFTKHERGTILLSNREEALAVTDTSTLQDLAPGTIAISLSAIPDDSLATLPQDASASDVVGMFASFSASAGSTSFGDVTETTIGEFNAASTTAIDGGTVNTLYAVDHGTYFVFSLSATREDEQATHNELIQSIIASTTFTAGG